MRKEDRIYQIDLYRFMAALGILSVHYLFRGYKADNLTDLNLLALGGEWVKYCFVFIDLFFIISGFVITLSVRNKSLGHFFKSRVMRIFSIYWLCASITYVVTTLYGAPKFTATFGQFLFNLTLLQDFFDVPSLDGAYWTMSLELRFYCLAMAYLLLYRYKKLPIITLSYCWLGLSILYIFVQDIFIVKVVDLFLMFKWSSTFAAGIIMGEISKTKKISFTHFFALVVSFGLSIYHRLIYAEESRVYYQTELSDNIIVIAMLGIYLIMLSAVLGKLKWLNRPVFLTLGLLTYPLYLLHQRIGYIIFNNLMYDVNKYVLLGSTICLMLAVSYIIVRWLSQPIAQFLDSILEHILQAVDNVKSAIKPAVAIKLKSILRSNKKN